MTRAPGHPATCNDDDNDDDMTMIKSYHITIHIRDVSPDENFSLLILGWIVKAGDLGLSARVEPDTSQHADHLSAQVCSAQYVLYDTSISEGAVYNRR